MPRMAPALFFTALIALPELALAQPGAPVATPAPANPTPIPPSAAPGTLPGPHSPPVAGSIPLVPRTGERARMIACSDTAGRRDLGGAARKTFMSACLSRETTPATMMKVCNAQANQDKMSADARRTYLSSCLKTPG